MEQKAFRLGAPYLCRSAGGVRLCSDVTMDGDTRTLWIEVSEKYAPYLADDRLDAFAAAFLPTAMRAGADIVCESPVSRRLLYQINHYILPVLSRNIPAYRLISLRAAAADEKLPCAGAAATGWSGGVDCMYTLKNRLHAAESGGRLTHLLIANVGALESDHNEELLRHLVRKAEDGIARETGLRVIGVNSNWDTAFQELYLSTVSFRLPAAVLALQKLFSVYYHSSTYEFSRFAFVEENSAYYEMFLLPHLSTENTVFYSSGGEVSRLEKLRALSDYPPAWRYLHPCIYTAGDNCGRCGKCVRTETALFALGTLDRFEKVFDVAAFERNRDWYIANILAKKSSQHYGETWELLRERGLITRRAEELSRMLSAAQKVVNDNRETLSRKLEGRQ